MGPQRCPGATPVTQSPWKKEQPKGWALKPIPGFSGRKSGQEVAGSCRTQGLSTGEWKGWDKERKRMPPAPALLPASRQRLPASRDTHVKQTLGPPNLSQMGLLPECVLFWGTSPPPTQERSLATSQVLFIHHLNTSLFSQPLLDDPLPLPDSLLLNWVLVSRWAKTSILQPAIKDLLNPFLYLCAAALQPACLDSGLQWTQASSGFRGGA